MSDVNTATSTRAEPHKPRSARTLRGTMFAAITMMALYGLALPTLVLSRLLPAARTLQEETVATSRAFSALRDQNDVFQQVVSIARTLDPQSAVTTAAERQALEDAVRNLRNAPRANYDELGVEMRQAFARSISLTDNFVTLLDEAVRAHRLSEDSTFHARLRMALSMVTAISQELNEAQRQGLEDLLTRQGRIREAGTTVVYLTLGWLALGAVLVWYVAYLTRQRLISAAGRT